MEPKRVSREQAELLKKVGYSEECLYRYDLYKGAKPEPVISLRPINWNEDDMAASAPTLDEAARWLREVKGWHVEVLRVESGWLSFIVPQTKSISCGEYTTHDLALSAGIDLILKKLEDGK